MFRASRCYLRPVSSGLQPVSRRHLSADAGGGQPERPLTSVLVANRGEIALRIQRTAEQYGIRMTSIYTDPDAKSRHALCTPFAVNLGKPSAYLDGNKIIEIAQSEGCDAIHPGYGFLSENSEFAKNCSSAGLTFIGPPWQAIEAMGNKSRAKEIMNAAGVPCIPGYHGSNQDPEFLKAEAKKIGFPVLLKAVKGGGGKGMRIVRSEAEFDGQLSSAKSEASSSFGDDAMLVEKYIQTPRHIEVQVFADKHGNCVALGERDCSIQRRHQKILEESPAPHLDESVRSDLWAKARAAALAVSYEGAGTVEFILDKDSGQFYFMEMNTRLQVEHPVTEMVVGEDLVHWQFLVAQGGRLPLTQDQVGLRIRSRGWAIEARIYAENPEMGFIPDSGVLLHVKTPSPSETVRIDTGFTAGDEISSHYDPMIAKLIIGGTSRQAALQKMRTALEEYEIAGPVTNIEFLKRVCNHSAFQSGEVETGFIQKHHEDLFQDASTPPEVFAQAAIACFLQESATENFTSSRFGSGELGFMSEQRYHTISFTINASKGKKTDVSVRLSLEEGNRFSVEIQDQKFNNIESEWDSTTRTVTSFFPYARFDTCVILSGSDITAFHRGQQYRLAATKPAWLTRALGIKETVNSVLAPMPCKVLRVDIEEGQEVAKDQPLLVIESMKMETTIRSPQAGVVAKILHQKGALCKSGAPLVEFK